MARKPLVIVVFKPLSGHTVGQCFPKSVGKVAFVDVSKDANPARTLVHEIVHLRHRKWSEKRVLKEERRIWDSLTFAEKLELLHQMFRGFNYEAEMW